MISEDLSDKILEMDLSYHNISEKSSAKSSENDSSFPLNFDSKALRMMEKMGYKKGSGLGKIEQGNTDVINITYQLGKRGFGSKLRNIDDANEFWDYSLEEIKVTQDVIWLSKDDPFSFTLAEMSLWPKEGPPITDVKTQSLFCEKEILHNVIDAKDIFDEMDNAELVKARAKSNPFETLRSAIFINRAALKIANIDAATDFMFTNIDHNEHFRGQEGPIYFADVCAGPGGFTEYVLWRKKWYAKGFGMTLKGENDFKLYNSCCACPATFQAFYGKDQKGDVCSPDNILDFKEKVMEETYGKGVHFMMSDGGFSVEGNENFQEILSKNIYLCQCIIALEIIRSHGNFVTKLFDLFTPFSIGLLYLLYGCFESVCILKPNSSRPANSERYFICKNLQKTQYCENVKQYLWTVVHRLLAIKNTDIDILDIVPLDIMKKDEKFFRYIYDSNNNLAIKQTLGLRKMATFYRNPTLDEYRQEDLRKESLELWKLPDKSKVPFPQIKLEDFIEKNLDNPEIMTVQPTLIKQMDAFNQVITNIEDWHYCPMYTSEQTPKSNFYACVRSTVFRLLNGKWTKAKNICLSRRTLFFAEYVKEDCVTKMENEETVSTRPTLHIIDAIQLGDMKVSHLSFSERQKLIQTYCKALNKESNPYLLRIRPKTIDKLINISRNCLITQGKPNLCTNLPCMGYKSTSESFNVNSLLLMKLNSSLSFNQRYTSRVHIFLKHNEDKDEDFLHLGDIVSKIKQRS